MNETAVCTVKKRQARRYVDMAVCMGLCIHNTMEISEQEALRLRRESGKLRTRVYRAKGHDKQAEKRAMRKAALLLVLLLLLLLSLPNPPPIPLPILPRVRSRTGREIWKAARTSTWRWNRRRRTRRRRHTGTG